MIGYDVPQRWSETTYQASMAALWRKFVHARPTLIQDGRSATVAGTCVRCGQGIMARPNSSLCSACLDANARAHKREHAAKRRVARLAS